MNLLKTAKISKNLQGMVCPHEDGIVKAQGCWFKIIQFGGRTSGMGFNGIVKR